MNKKSILAIAALAGTLAACGGGGDAPAAAAPPTAHPVTLSWQPNRESGVNGPGGGYRVTINDKAATIEVIDVPYDAASGVTPTTAATSLYPGTYAATVLAYAALDGTGGSSGSSSAPSDPVTIVVPQ